MCSTSTRSRTFAGHGSSDAGAGSAAGIGKRRRDHVDCRSKARRTGDRRGADDARSIVLDQLPHASRHVLNGAGVGGQGRGLRGHGLVDLEHRAVNPSRHRYRGSHLQRGEHERPDPDRLSSDLRTSKYTLLPRLLERKQTS